MVFVVRALFTFFIKWIASTIQLCVLFYLTSQSSLKRPDLLKWCILKTLEFSHLFIDVLKYINIRFDCLGDWNNILFSFYFLGFGFLLGLLSWRRHSVEPSFCQFNPQHAFPFLLPLRKLLVLNSDDLEPCLYIVHSQTNRFILRIQFILDRHYEPLQCCIRLLHHPYNIISDLNPCSLQWRPFQNISQLKQIIFNHLDSHSQP